ncbi:hypothetical protein M404DRAFT_657254 [Pisolithus tinctorius Marx 270]|uniref:Uncharacterized protein n=1 Tax=Pisolithus tinctorius Marx 270 TaxID=870435 RepID=A0A0C3P4T6_PISTI|nr:hypothetical protein M404DRAFT_657254 [Pisolithus tinctorius Marx 270]
MKHAKRLACHVMADKLIHTSAKLARPHTWQVTVPNIPSEQVWALRYGVATK